jgi:hypothetical protein
MPSLVHTTNALQVGLALTDESVSEQASGLVSVQMKFVCRASNNSRLGKLFYNDAPPPIFPKSLQASELIGRRLFMVSRSVTQSNGLAYVQAEYAGGYATKRNNVLIYTDRESDQTVTFVGSPFTLTSVNPQTGGTQVASDLVNFFTYTYVPIILTYEYVEVGTAAAYTPAPPKITELYKLSAFNSSIWVRAPELGWAGIKTISYERSFYEDLLARNGIKEDRKPNYVTQTVKTIQHRFYI